MKVFSEITIVCLFLFAEKPVVKVFFYKTMNSSSDEVLQMFEKKERERFCVLERVIDNVFSSENYGNVIFRDFDFIPSNYCENYENEKDLI
jgi:hypothetical protein